MFGLFGERTRRELYTIVRGSQIFRYSSGDKDVTVGEVTWNKLAIKRGSISSSSDLEKNSLEVTFAADSEFAQSCLRSALEEVVFLTLSKYQSGTVSLLWQGRLTGVKPDAATIVLTFENDYTSLARAGVRYKYQRTCAHDLYGEGCKLDKDAWAVQSTVKSVGGVTVVLRGLEGYADNYFMLGMLKNSNNVYISIESSTQNTMTLIRRLDSLSDYLTSDEDLDVLADAATALATAQSEYDAAVSARDALDPTSQEYIDAQVIVDEKQMVLATTQADYDAAAASVHYVYVYPGCVHSISACNTFGNTDNFMGFPYIPEDNPTIVRII
ncbi:baseplate hub domain-containing protein [Acinetobacter sp. ANC 5502]